MIPEDVKDVIPADDTRLWRYMSLDKYLFLVSRSQLYFCRVDKLPDPWEGAPPISLIEFLRSNDSVDEESVNRMSGTYRNLSRSTFVSCWHANENESAAMWDQYGRHNAAIAVVSKVGNVTNSMTNSKFDRVVYHGRVR